MVKTKIELISQRAKTLYNPKKNKWIDCIKLASKQLKKEGKI